MDKNVTMAAETKEMLDRWDCLGWGSQGDNGCGSCEGGDETVEEEGMAIL